MNTLVDQLRNLGNAEDAVAKAQYLQAFPGGYAEGDQFFGVKVPVVRSVAREAKKYVTLEDVAELLVHEVHEVRLLGAILTVELYKPAHTSPHMREAIVKLLLTHVESLNNWDLVDTAAPFTLGPWLLTQPTSAQDDILDELAASPLLWRRRMAMVATLGMIRAGELRQTFRLAEKLLYDEHDLMHKAVGWMLREAGQRERAQLDAFLDQYASTMPRTTLRYALEKYDAETRRHYMQMR